MDINRENSRATNDDNEAKDSLTQKAPAETVLQNAIQMIEIGMDIKERCVAAEKYVAYLRSLTIKAGKSMNTLHTISTSFLALAHKLIVSTISNIENVDGSCNHLKSEFDRLLSILERELTDIDDLDNMQFASTVCNINERIKYLETKQKLADITYLRRSSSVKSMKSDVDEKYPDYWSRDSLMDLDSVSNLPPVPEDIFTAFVNKPARTSSLSSLKGRRKVKLLLQRVANSEDDDDSPDFDDHDSLPRVGDVDERSQKLAKTHLGNIKEESQY